MKNTLFAILSPLLVSTLLLFSALMASAAERADSVEIHFRQGHSEIERNLPGNDKALSRLDSIAASPQGVIGIRIIGTASPEGPVDLNNHLSDRRAEIISSRLKELSDGNLSATEILFTGRDWQGLYDYVQNTPETPYRESTIEYLRLVTDSLRREKHESENDHFLSGLKKLNGGVPYSYLYTQVFPYLRSSKIYIDYFTSPIPDYSLGLPPALLIPDLNTDGIDVVSAPLYPEKRGRNFYMALKTNMLYDVLALPSLGAEFYLGKNISIVGNWTYGWWDTDRTHYYWRAYGGDLALRWWFGKAAAQKPLTGHHLGIYGGITTYDFEFGGTGYMGGLPHETLWNRSLRMAGIEYGYSLPIARRLNIDFTIGIGYLGGKYIKYIPDNGRYLWQSTHKINWFGPTKAEISLVWLIGNGNFNLPKSKKGGMK